MSVKHFIRTVWAEKIQQDLEEQCKLVQDCTRAYEGECEYAKTVKILAVGDPTVGPYVGQDIDIEEMTDDSQDLVIDVQNYFAFQVNDVDKAQSTADEYAKNDTYKPGAETIIVAESNSQEHIKAALDEAIVTLREKNFDEDGVIEIDPRSHKTFKNELIELKTANDELIKRGVVGKYDNYDVKSTNNVYRDANYVYCIVRSREAIAFAGQINEVEAGRMERRFADYVRGLDTFGAKIIAQDELVCVKIPLPAAG